MHSDKRVVPRDAGGGDGGDGIPRILVVRVMYRQERRRAFADVRSKPFRILTHGHEPYHPTPFYCVACPPEIVRYRDSNAVAAEGRDVACVPNLLHRAEGCANASANVKAGLGELGRVPRVPA